MKWDQALDAAPELSVTDHLQRFMLGYALAGARAETPVELWHDIYDASIAAGHDPVEGVRRADARHWPQGERVPVGFDAVALECSPFVPGVSRSVSS